MASLVIRPPHLSELGSLSALQMRSKAHWGYDDAFMAACKDELTLTPKDLSDTALAVGDLDGVLVGVAQVGPCGQDAELLALFIDPPYIGSGFGKQLFAWCVTAARNVSQTRLLIDADPDAASFYERMGAKRIGSTPSGSVPGRLLPQYEYPLR